MFYRYLNRKPAQLPLFPPNYNMSPTHVVPVVRAREGERTIDLLRWGLIPYWAKDEKIGYKMINSRCETVAEKPSFRKAFQSRRCIVPVSGFFEWKRDGKIKRPFRIFLKDEPIMSLAGIWESWKNPEGETVYTFSILTTEANTFMARIHDRMPVILARGDEEAWLDPETPMERVHSLLKPCPPEWLDAVEVSTAVNNPKNNAPELLEPLESA